MTGGVGGAGGLGGLGKPSLPDGGPHGGMSPAQGGGTPGNVGAPNQITSGETMKALGKQIKSQMPTGDATASPTVSPPEKSPLFDDAAVLAGEKRNLRQRRRPLLATANTDASTLGSSGSIFNRKDYGSTI